MSNIGNIFGNEGWVQSSIDRSRGKTRPGEKARKAANWNAQRRQQLLDNDPLVQKYSSAAQKKQRATSSKGILGGLLVPRGTTGI